MNNWFEISLAAFFIIGPFSIIYLLDRRTKTNTPLFTDKSTCLQQLVAFVLSLIFAAFATYAIFIGSWGISIMFGTVALALFGHAFGDDSLLNKIQKSPPAKSPPAKTPISETPISERPPHQPIIRAPSKSPPVRILRKRPTSCKCCGFEGNVAEKNCPRCGEELTFKPMWLV